MPCDIAGVVSVHILRRLYLKQKLQNRFPVVSLLSPRYFPDVVSLFLLIVFHLPPRNAWSANNSQLVSACFHI